LTLADLIRLHDETANEVRNCEAGMIDDRRQLECEAEFRRDEWGRRKATAERAHEIVKAKLAAAGKLLLTLATGTELPAMIRDAVEVLAKGKLQVWIDHADQQAKRLQATMTKLKAECDYYERRLEQLKELPLKE
jgi:hypothetical protein